MLPYKTPYTSVMAAIEKLYVDLKEIVTYHNLVGTYTREDKSSIPAITYTPINPQWRTNGVECSISVAGVKELTRLFNNRTVSIYEIQISFINHSGYVTLALYKPVLAQPPKAVWDYLRHNWGVIQPPQYSAANSFGKNAFQLEQLNLVVEVMVYS